MDYENFGTLSVRIDQGVAVITFDNGEINLFDLPLINDLDRASRQIEADPSCAWWCCKAPTRSSSSRTST